MPTLSAWVSLKHINDITECPVCNEIFTDPRLLPCIHTFCSECLVKWADDKAIGGKLACPLCTKEVRISDDVGASGAERIAHLPKNFFVQKLLDARKLSNALSSAETICDICSDCDANGNATESALVHRASVYCTECGQNMCEQCRLYHRKMKTSSGHKIVELESRLQDGQVLIDLPENRCDKHSDKTPELFCFDCKLPACTKCFVSCHKSHNCTDVVVAADEMRHQMNDDMKSIVDRASEYRRKLSQLDHEAQSDFCRKIDESAKLVIETAKKMRQIVDTYEAKLLERLDSAKMQHAKKVESVRQELETSMMMLDIFKQYLEQLRSKGTPCDIAMVASSLHNRARELLNHKIRARGVTSGLMNVQFTSEFSSDNVESLFGELCIEKGKDVNIPSSEVVGVIHRKVGQDVTGITTFDDEVFVICQRANNIDVYDAESLKLKRLLSLGCQKANQSSLTACERNKCIYMSICHLNTIYRIELVGNGTKTWKTERAPRGVSTNTGANLLVACCEANRIQEFTTDGRLLREVVLQTSATGPLYITHVIQLPNDQFAITYCGSMRGFAVVDCDGRAIRSYAGPPQTGDGRIFMPRGLASMSECGDVLIASEFQVSVLNLETFCVTQLDVIVPDVPHRRRMYTQCVHYDQTRHLLYIGEHGAESRVLVVAVQERYN